MIQPQQLTLVEVSMRDGIQSQETILSPEQRADYLKGFLDAGHRHIEVGSYVNPKLLPQVARTSEVLNLLQEHPAYQEAESIALTLNTKGIEQAINDPITTLGFVCGCSDTFNKKNMGKSASELIALYKDSLALIREKNKKIRFYLSTITHCGYEGSISRDRLNDLCKLIKTEINPDYLILSDTHGTVLPTEIEELISVAHNFFTKDKIGFHFHDPYGRALLNVYEAYQLGIHIFDMAAAGLGGCPYATNTEGNIASEDVIHLFQQINHNQTIDLKKHMKTTKDLIGSLEFTSPSKAYQTLSKTFMEGVA